MRTKVRAFAPGSIGNIGPGLDILGCALTGLGDAVTATVTDVAGVRIDVPGHSTLPMAADAHTAGIAATKVLERAGLLNRGLALRVEKGLPISGGQGGSAASAVAAAVAVNALFDAGLNAAELLLCALSAEERVAGRHLDNLAPCLLGGIVLVRCVYPMDIVALPVPAELRVVVVHPEQLLRTADARRVLPDRVDRATAMQQAAAVAGMVAALHAGDFALLSRSVDDRIAEPARLALLPGFAEAKAAALDAGAFGCSISGAGPSAFAFASSDAGASLIGEAMVAAYDAKGIAATARVARIDERGARVEDAA